MCLSICLCFVFFSLAPQKNGVSVWFFSQWKCLPSFFLGHYRWTFQLSDAHLGNWHSGVPWDKWRLHSAFNSVVMFVTSYFASCGFKQEILQNPCSEMLLHSQSGEVIG